MRVSAPLSKSAPPRQRLPMLPMIPVEAPLDIVVTVPGSKSLSNRALVVASLAEGKSRLSNVLHSDDTRFMMSHLRTLGIALQTLDDEIEIEGRRSPLK